MNAIFSKMQSSKMQRMLNGIIFIVLIIWIVSIHEYVHISSGIRIHRKFNLLLITTAIYFVQAIFNKPWLNTLLLSLYLLLLGYVMYAFIYSFFDPHDSIMRKQNGLPIKIWETTIKSTILLLACYFTWLTRPKKERYQS